MTRAFSFESVAEKQTRPVGPVLLIGGGGMLGRAWRQLLEAQGVGCVAPRRADLDITKPHTIDDYVTGGFPLVVNCAAWTDVDGAETHIEQARALNAMAVNDLAQRCGRAGSTLVHYSTDYVFNGQASTPYAVNSPTDPINRYAETKWMGEVFLQRSGCRYLLVRTSWVYAPWGTNFVRTIARLCRDRESLNVVNDQRGRPTSAEHLARTTLALLRHGATGVYHVCDGGEATWFDFARAIAGYFNPACRVEPCTTAEFPRPAKRPAYGVLSLTKTEQELGPMPHWRDNLKDVLRRLEG